MTLDSENNGNVEDKAWYQTWPLVVGWLLTAVWGGCVVTYIFRNWKAVCCLDPNALGDFTAGARAPLAFLWLVVAVLLQTEELGLQRKELRATRKEQEKLVRQAELSKDIADRDLRLREAADTEERLNRVLDVLAAKIERLAPRTWANSKHNRFPVFVIKDPTSVDDMLAFALSDAVSFTNAVKGNAGAFRMEKPAAEEIVRLIPQFESVIANARTSKSPIALMRIEIVELERLVTTLRSVEGLISKMTLT